MVFRGPEMELPLLQTVQISSNWTSRVPATKGIATEPVSAGTPNPPTSRGPSNTAKEFALRCGSRKVWQSKGAPNSPQSLITWPTSQAKRVSTWSFHDVLARALCT